MKVRSTSFHDGGEIPLKHAFSGMGCTGDNVSPHLAWSDAPAGTKSFAVVMHDPDAPTSGGPCPPPGPAHRYNITVHALDTEKLPLDEATTGAKLEFMASQHTLAKATISGRFARS